MSQRQVIAGLIAFTLVVSLSLIPEAAPQSGEEVTVSLVPSADAFADQGQPSQSFGSADVLVVRSQQSGNARVYVFFDLSSIPRGAEVLSARLTLHVENPPPFERAYWCYRAASSWSEGTISWSARPQTSSIYSSSATVSASANSVTWDVTAMVQKMLYGIPEQSWPNYGWEIFDGQEDSGQQVETTLHSREAASASDRPSLVIRFAPPRIDLVPQSTSMIAQTWVQIIVKRLSQGGPLITVGDRIVRQDWISTGTLTVHLSSTSAGGRFSLSPGGETVDRVTLSEGLTQLSLYYFDENPGTAIIRGSTSDYLAGYYLADSETIEVIVDTTPPSVTGVSRTPESPAMGDSVKVSAVVNDTGSGTKDVTLRYSIGGSPTWIEVPMSLQAGAYVAYIPSQSPFSEVQYQIRATDNSGNVAETPIDEFTVGMPLWVYAGVVVVPAAVIFVVLRFVRKKP